MLRLVPLICGLAVGAYSLPAAFLNGLTMGGPGFSGYMIGSAMVGVLGVSWFGGSWGFRLITNRIWIGGPLVLAAWLASVVLVLTMSAGFVATHRIEMVGQRQDQIDRWQRAQANWQQRQAEIQTADALGRTTRSDKLKQEAQRAEGVLDAGRPVSADTQAEILSWATGGYISVAQIEKAFPIWVTVVAELACIAAFTTWSSWPAQASAPVKKIKRQVRSSPRRSKPTKVAESGPEAVIDLEKKRAQRATASWAS